MTVPSCSGEMSGATRGFSYDISYPGCASAGFGCFLFLNPSPMAPVESPEPADPPSSTYCSQQAKRKPFSFFQNSSLLLPKHREVLNATDKAISGLPDRAKNSYSSAANVNKRWNITNELFTCWKVNAQISSRFCGSTWPLSEPHENLHDLLKKYRTCSR